MVAFACLLFISQVNAQNTIQESNQFDSSENPIDLKSLSPELLLLYLSNELVVAAGVGFESAVIGDPLSSILNIWGDPVESRKTGILGSYELLYQPDPNLLVVFTGRETIKTISIKGSPAALFRTVRGARFGTPISIISRLYAFAEADVKRDRVDFDEIGISFHFTVDRVSKVVIYQPDT